VTDEARENRAAYHKWQDEKDREANRRIAAFTRNESIYEDDQPSIPKYGQPLEGTVSAPGLEVKVYTQVRTAAEVEKLEREKRHYQNIVLERQEICQICQFGLMGFDTEAKSDHLDKHVRAYQANQACPFCENEDWGDMQVADKSKHVRLHVAGISSESMQIVCPWCNLSLEDKANEEQRAHYSSHVRGVPGEPAVVEVQKITCPWCRTDVTALDKDTQKKHCASHIYMKCSWPACDSILMGESDEFQYNHFKAHIEQLYELREKDRQLSCALCCQKFEQHDEELIIDHFQSHCYRQCPWPGCSRIFTNADGEDAKRLHISAHTAAKVSSLGAEESELYYIPEWLRELFPGKLFYCPERACAQNVSGRSREPCKVRWDHKLLRGLQLTWLSIIATLAMLGKRGTINGWY
jgi:hypothetical protein